MKNILNKVICSLLCTLLLSSNVTYASLIIDYNVESSDDFHIEASGKEDALSSYSLPVIDYEVESSKDNLYIESINDEPVDMSLLNEVSFLASFFAGGSGTADDPYLITTAKHLEALSSFTSIGSAYREAYYRLENDIDLQGKEWSPIGLYQNSPNYSYSFKGTFDGNNKTISNFKITKTDNDDNIIGLFGLVTNGTIKNLTVSGATIDIGKDIDLENALYVGALVGRITTSGTDNQSAIINCHVKDSTVNVKGKYRIYAGGLTGYMHVEDQASFIFENCSVDADCNFLIDDTIPYANDRLRSIMRVGGAIGYAAVIDGNMSISNSLSNSRVISQFKNVDKNRPSDDIHIGGFIGNFSTSTAASALNKAKIDIDSCYSTNLVYANNIGAIYSGGFTGYIVTTRSDITVKNCHTSSNVYTYSAATTIYTGGFASIVGIDGEGKISIDSSYSSANNIDLSASSVGGKLTAYIEGTPTFNNFYSFTDNILRTTNIISEVYETIISNEELSDLNNYVGFDRDVWMLKAESDYLYPVLIENEFSSSDYHLYYVLDKREMPIKYSPSLSYADIATVMPDKTPESIYEFSHWSFVPASDKDIFDGTFSIKSDTVVFPNDSDEYKSFDIKFYANGSLFETKNIKYNSLVDFPAAPKKESDIVYRYVFSHWSDSEDGEAVDTGNTLVKGNASYYAVYKRVETGVWDGQTMSDFANGDGSVETPYEINNATQLYKLSYEVNNGNEDYISANYILTKDIDLGANEWLPIGNEIYSFEGTFDGNGYSIYNFKLSDSEKFYIGLFGNINNATIKKLEVSGIDIDVSTTKNTVYIGGITGYASSSNTLETHINECFTEGSINVTGVSAYVGGIAGYTNSEKNTLFKISNSYSTANITANTSANSTIGGIVGKHSAEKAGVSYIDNCYSVSELEAISDVTSCAGGIVGFIFNGDDWIGASLQEETYTFAEESDSSLCSVRNCFYAGVKIDSISEMNESHAGAIYADKNSPAKIYNCLYLSTLQLNGYKKPTNTNVIPVNDISELQSATKLSEELSFDFSEIWVEKESSLPVLKVFQQIKNAFRIIEYKLDEDNTLTTTLKICYRDVESYVIMLGAYDERGKMIGFKMEAVTNPSELQEINLEIEKMDKALYSKLTIINPNTLAFVENPITLSNE